MNKKIPMIKQSWSDDNHILYLKVKTPVDIYTFEKALGDNYSIAIDPDTYLFYYVEHAEENKNES